MLSLLSSGRSALALSLLPTLTLAADPSRSVHSISAAPDGWTRGARASNDTAITLRLTLPPSDPNALQDALAAVSTPGSSRYGQYLSREEAGALMAPSNASSSSVITWLDRFSLAGKVQSSPGGDVLHVATSVAVAERLLEPAQFYFFTHPADTSRPALRSLSWGAPKELDDALDTVQPTVLFPSWVKAASRDNRPEGGSTLQGLGQDITPNASTSCAALFTPDCARSHYGLGNYTFKAADKNGVAVYAEEGYSRKSWMKTYLERFNPAHASSSWHVKTVDVHVNTSSQPDEEATLDLDILVSLTAPTPITLVDVPTNRWEGLAEFHLVDYLLNLTDAELPKTASISYGWHELAQFDKKDLSKMLTSLCNAYGQLGTRGVSVIAASGDDGTGGDECGHPGKFLADFPASCPYVTAVGATRNIPETTVKWSGGGFSEFFARPSWQDEAVNGYLKFLGSNDTGLYNKTGRAFPDVSAFGVNWSIYYGKWTTVGGTSASCPTVAAITTALNDHQLAAGKPTLGFLNPWIYGKSAGAWQDVTTGSNACGGGKGFAATKGWDPATGFGTPNFEALLKVLP